MSTGVEIAAAYVAQLWQISPTNPFLPLEAFLEAYPPASGVR